jgi:Na+/proline symporter
LETSEREYRLYISHSELQQRLTSISVFLDNGYYNKAIAASPVHALPGYIMGGISWFAIPWLCATTMGLAAIALEGNPAFPTYPNRMDPADVSAGLVLPYAAVAILGGGGAVCTLLIVFMAVTSASSAELIAVSSIFTYDIYQTYFNPTASGKRLIYMSHAMVIGYGLFMAAFSVGRTFSPVRLIPSKSTLNKNKQYTTPESPWVTST